jgi:hypothetical protein
MSEALVITFGEILGALLIANEVDTIIGSPIKEALGVGPPDLDYDRTAPTYFQQKAMDKATGLVNYMHSLAGIAPGYVARERPRLETSYREAINLREQARDLETQRTQVVEAPAYTPPPYIVYGDR